MSTGDKGNEAEIPGTSPGEKIAFRMLQAIEEANSNASATRELLIELRDLLAEDIKVRKAQAEATDELCGRLEVFSIAADILSDVAENGKHLTTGDIAHAVAQATEDIFGEDGDDDGGEDPEPDPDPDPDLDKVPAIPRKRRNS